MKFLPPVQLTIERAKELSAQITLERQKVLENIVEYVVNAETPKLTFICTHNSRRSHLGQVWAKVMAEEFGFENVQTYSGGTEETACHPNTLAALEAQGFRVETPEGENPVNKLSYSLESSAIHCWSKKYDAKENPQKDFAAIMTCGHADENCPVIPGASVRIPCTYVDPKVSDGTPEQEKTYRERSLQIASEMAWVFHSAQKQIEPKLGSCCDPKSGCC